MNLLIFPGSCSVLRLIYKKEFLNFSEAACTAESKVLESKEASLSSL